jgi:hypothetical protein
MAIPMDMATMRNSFRTGQYILVDKKPVQASSIFEWGNFMEDNDVKRVGIDYFKDKSIRVSTVFLGIDHNFRSEGPPVLFETMIFGGNLSEYQDRYCTWEEAEEGHSEAIKKIYEDAIEQNDLLLAYEIKNKYPKLIK